MNEEFYIQGFPQDQNDLRLSWTLSLTIIQQVSNISILYF